MATERSIEAMISMKRWNVS